jgi:hypothetical protein
MRKRSVLRDLTSETGEVFRIRFNWHAILTEEVLFLIGDAGLPMYLRCKITHPYLGPISASTGGFVAVYYQIFEKSWQIPSSERAYP